MENQKTKNPELNYRMDSRGIPQPTEGNVPDELNPNYMFQVIRVELLAKIACGDLDPVVLVLRELRNRGLNREGRWVGYDTENKFWSYNLDKFVTIPDRDDPEE